MNRVPVCVCVCVYSTGRLNDRERETERKKRFGEERTRGKQGVGYIWEEWNDIVFIESKRVKVSDCVVSAYLDYVLAHIYFINTIHTRSRTYNLR